MYVSVLYTEQGRTAMSIVGGWNTNQSQKYSSVRKLPHLTLFRQPLHHGYTSTADKDSYMSGKSTSGTIPARGELRVYA